MSEEENPPFKSFRIFDVSELTDYCKYRDPRKYLFIYILCKVYNYTYITSKE